MVKYNKKKILASVFLGLIIAIMYLPIIWLIVFSFTNTTSISNWSGFSLDAYKELFAGVSSGEIFSALSNTLFIALLASAISTILGTMAAIGINALRSKRIKAAYSAVNQIPMVNSEIVTAIGLMLLFGLFKTFLPVQGNAELVAVIFAHVAFCTPYVVLNVLPRIRQTDNKIYEAALDLGCTPWQALRKVVLPDIFPGIVMGFMMSVTLSIDDFVITNFTIDGFYTLSTLIYAKASGKKPLPIEMRALSAIIFIVILALMLIITRVNQKSDADKKAVKK